MLSVGPLWGLTVTARGGPRNRPMGKKNAAAGGGLAAVAATVTAANNRAGVRGGGIGPPIGGWTDSHLRGEDGGLWPGSMWWTSRNGRFPAEIKTITDARSLGCS